MHAQYFLKGEVKSEKNEYLSQTLFLQRSTGKSFRTDSVGRFSISSAFSSDTLIFSRSGFHKKKVVVKYGQFESVILQPLPTQLVKRQDKLISLVREKENNQLTSNISNGETYSKLIENKFITTSSYPSTGFALSVDRAAYTNIRRYLNTGSLIPPDGVRIEEILNYFPVKGEPVDSPSFFQFQSQLTECPWNQGNQLMLMNVRARKVNFDHLPPSNLVFLVDVSGSMDFPNRLPLLKKSFRLLIENLRVQDTVSIISYGGSVVVALPPTAGTEKQKILKVVEELTAGGDTPGEYALQAGYRMAQSNFIKGGNNRIILATDGNFNVGRIKDEEIMELVAAKQFLGIKLTCLGVGVGNYKDSKLELMAKKGNGNFAYLDNEMEAERFLVKEITQSLFNVAEDVYLDVSFDSTYVKEYRLIGYDNKKRSGGDTSTVLEGGELGSAHSITAIFELVPKGKNISSPSRIASVELSYLPEGMFDKRSELFSCLNNYKPVMQIDSSYRLLIAAAEFGLLLRKSSHAGKANWAHLEKLTKTAANPRDFWQKEFMLMIKKAKELYKTNKWNFNLW